jgi:hypothetical protein
MDKLGNLYVKLFLLDLFDHFKILLYLLLLDAFFVFLRDAKFEMMTKILIENFIMTKYIDWSDILLIQQNRFDFGRHG